MRMREKLIEMLGDDVCKHETCDECEFCEDKDACISFLKDGSVSPYAWQFRKPGDFCSYGERRNSL